MKTKRIIIWSFIALFTVTFALEVFILHPSFKIGKYEVRLSGMRYMRYKMFGKTEGGDFIHGRMENKSTVYLVGPISIWTRHD